MLWWVHNFELNNAGEFMALISTMRMIPKPPNPLSPQVISNYRLNTSVSQRQLKTSVPSTKLIISDDPSHPALPSPPPPLAPAFTSA